MIDTDALSIKIDDGSFALEDCSSELMHCYINIEIGFHIVFPKKCDPTVESPWHIGGHKFYITRFSRHTDIRDGIYISDLDHRFAYEYGTTLGLFEVRYDRTGSMLFGLGQSGNSLN